MQALLPYPNFAASAKVLDTTRLGVQRKQILRILNLHHRVILTPGNVEDQYLTGPTKADNHPAVRMWDGHIVSLCEYGLVICEEWIKRGGIDLVKPCIESHMEWATDSDFSMENPVWFGEPSFHLAQQAYLIRRDPGFYIPKFPGVEADLPLIYPSA